MCNLQWVVRSPAPPLAHPPTLTQTSSPLLLTASVQNTDQTELPTLSVDHFWPTLTLISNLCPSSSAAAAASAAETESPSAGQYFIFQPRLAEEQNALEAPSGAEHRFGIILNQTSLLFSSAAILIMWVWNLVVPRGHL